MRIFRRAQLLRQQKAPAGASSDTSLHSHRAPPHTSFNFMRRRCRDTKLGRLPLGFSWLQQREPWTCFRAGARTFLEQKVTCPPLPLPCPHIDPSTHSSFLVPSRSRCFPFSHGNPSLKCSSGCRAPSVRDGYGSWHPWDVPAGARWCWRL